ncbi:MAG: sigma-54-dependent Fis family transcriptional regulator [Deltaproteobacteria bacterium]|nr:MAG: sigma-54-dependent Fis family transcriptional regulator [Deltaproteobacteria bacterium]
MTKVLVVDDERKMRRVLQIELERMGIDSVAAESGEEALARFQSEKIDLVLTDLKMPGMSGLELLARVRELDADVPVIVLTAYGTVQTAVEAMKLGAFDYVLKPFDLEAVELTVRKGLEMQQYRSENRYLRERVEQAPAFDSLVGGSAAMQAVYDFIRLVGPTRSAVLVTGETGTGKELVAQAIHGLSPRRQRLFVPLNCAAIPADLLESELFGHARGAFTGAHSERTGKFEVADGGTLFLDEIGDMAYPLQAKLLRVLQEGVIERIGSNKRISVDVRVLSSTNRDLGGAIRAGTFREDLYYRLNVLQIQLPPLRERREDISHLAAFFLARFSQQLGKPTPALAPAACQLLEQYPWPGNVRELQNLMERAVVLAVGAEIEPSFFRLLLPQAATTAPESSGETLALEPAIEELERKLILRALSAADDNKAHAARLLGISERTLWYKLKRYGL